MAKKVEEEKVEGEEQAEGEEKPKKEKKEKPLHDNYIGDFTAKLADIEEPHYVKITDLVLKYDPIKYKLLAAELGERDAEIKDTINTILISKTSEVNSVKGKEELKEEIKEKINAMLIEGQIPEVLFQVIVQ
ncbi:flagellar basal body-associated FliL family protein [Candidatus Desantisbacteria bacterium]|nr:flagellar basal body-associated FliL family protein [Candidatus Desantisbacteria bacterium]